MAALANKEGATALSPIAKAAQAFLAIGGRLMLDPAGKYEAAIDAGLIFARTWPDPEDDAPYIERYRIVRAFNRIEKRHMRFLASLVRQHGQPTPNGWLVWEAGQ